MTYAVRAAPSADGPSPALLRELRDLLGPEGVIEEAGRLLAYESDGLTSYRSAPRAVLFPETTESAARALRLLHEAGVPVAPRGAGTGLSGGALAPEGGVVVCTTRMNRILALEPENRRARVQPGVVNTRLSEAARPLGLHYAPDPSSQTACTLGGNVAENSGGPHCLKYGVTTRYVTGLTLVRPDGEVLELGGRFRERDSLDLVGLTVGSEGCFGLVTEIEVGLRPLPEGVTTLLAIFDSLEEGGRAVTRILTGGLLPAALEIIDGNTIRAVEASVYAAGYPVDAGAALVVEFDGTVAGLEGAARKAEAFCRDEGAREVRRARDDEERAALWKGRKKAFGAMGRVAPDLMVQDATVPRSRLPDVLRRIDEIAAEEGLTVANVFHAGDGNLHPNILFDRRDPATVERVERASTAIMEVCVDAGGTITGEHGVGVDKRRYMTLVFGPDELALQAAVKGAFDPGGTFNPGKVLPDGVEPFRPAGTRPDGPPVATDRSGGEPGPGGDPDRGPSPRREGRIVHYEPADLTLTATGGLTLEALAAAAGPEGQWLPVLEGADGLGVRPGATLADLVLEAPLTGLAPLYGGVRDLVLGLTLRTPDGRDLRLGGRVVKNVAGFDLVRLVVGSRGVLGAVTEVTVRLHPRPEAELRLEARSESLSELVRAARAVATAPVVPASTVLERTPWGARLRVLLHGAVEAVEEEARKLVAVVPELAERTHGEEAGRGARGGSEARDGTHAAGAPGLVTARLRLSPTRLAELVAAAEGLAEAGRLRIDPVGGAAVVTLPSAGPAVAGALRSARITLEAAGGGLRVEEAPRELLADVPALGEQDPGVSRLTDRLVRLFDPSRPPASAPGSPGPSAGPHPGVAPGSPGEDGG